MYNCTYIYKIICINITGNGKVRKPLLNTKKHKTKKFALFDRPQFSVRSNN